jgi:hypothetical protein
MSTSLKSRDNAVSNHREQRAGKNDLHRSPINDDLTSAYTWGTPKTSLFTGRSRHYDA